MLAFLRSRVTIMYVNPLHAGRHPFQTFILSLCVISGLPLLFKQIPASSVEAFLPEWVAVTWGCALTIGAVLALVGAYWPEKWNYATALTLERIGLDIVGPAALLYSVVIFAFRGYGSAVAAAIVFGFAISCLIRAGDIGVIIQRAIKENSKQNSGRG